LSFYYFGSLIDFGRIFRLLQTGTDSPKHAKDK